MADLPDEIRTERLLLRPCALTDAERIAAIWSDPEVMRYMGGPRDRVQTADYVREHAESPPDGVWWWTVVEQSADQFIGTCDVITKEIDGRSEREIVYVLRRDVWGRGFATEAALAVRDYALARIDPPRLIATIDPDNTASQRVAVKIGMTHERDTVRPSGRTMRVYAIER